MVNTQADSDDEVEVTLRMLSRGFLDLHLGVRAGEMEVSGSISRNGSYPTFASRYLIAGYA